LGGVYILKGIYCITCSVNSKVYIGSSKDLTSRRYRHFSKLRNNKHYNHELQKDFNQYGETNFTFHILEEVGNIDDLLSREQFFLDSKLDSEKYNIYSKAGSPEGHLHSKEHKEKLSKARIGEGNNRSTITEDQVKEIKRILIEGKLNLNEIATHFNTNRNVISDIKHNRSWSHIFVEGEDSIKVMKKTMLTDDLVKQIKNDLKEKVLTYKEIANKYNIGKSQIDRLVAGKIFSNVL
jgi:group I intron endonuclease